VDIEEDFRQLVCRALLQTPCQGAFPGENRCDAANGRCGAASHAGFGTTAAAALQQVSVDSLI